MPTITQQPRRRLIRELPASLRPVTRLKPTPRIVEVVFFFSSKSSGSFTANIREIYYSK